MSIYQNTTIDNTLLISIVAGVSYTIVDVCSGSFVKAAFIANGSSVFEVLTELAPSSLILLAPDDGDEGYALFTLRPFCL